MAVMHNTYTHIYILTLTTNICNNIFPRYLQQMFITSTKNVFKCLLATKKPQWNKKIPSRKLEEAEQGTLDYSSSGEKHCEWETRICGGDDSESWCGHSQYSYLWDQYSSENNKHRPHLQASDKVSLSKEGVWFTVIPAVLQRSV